MVKASHILAIDPGPTESAFLILEDLRPARFGKWGNEKLLAALRLGEITAPRVAIEMVASFGMPVGREVFETCVFIGRMVEAIHEPRPEFIYRKDVKLHLCSSPRAKDAHIRQALIDRFGPPGTKKLPGVTYGITSDVWSALAVAVTALEMKPVKPV